MAVRRFAQVLITAAPFVFGAVAAQDKPNILVIWGDDVGQSNISAYSLGVMGYRTPNIDRIAAEGMLFTDYYGEPWSTAGRSSYITGQSVYRTGLFEAGEPGNARGMHNEDPTIAGLLREYGYMTGQFGKNHLGDKDVHLPTNHGFDEFFGNLYDAGLSEEPEKASQPDESAAARHPRRRGVIRSFANGRISDTGPLTQERARVFDRETIAAAIDFMERANADGKPFYVWWNGNRTYGKEEVPGIYGQEKYGEAMTEHDSYVGQLLARLDELGIADNTIVHYTTDSGPHPDVTPFPGDRNANFEGGRRVPSLVRWPGRIEARSISNEIMHHMDWLPTLLAAAGTADIKERLKDDGVRATGRRYKVHLDGYNFLPHLSGEEESGPRREIFYFADTGELTAVRFDDWKALLLEQKQDDVLQEESAPWSPLPVPLIVNLRRDPYEAKSLTYDTQDDWMIDRTVFVEPAQSRLSDFLATLEEFPPRQPPSGITVEQVLEMLQWAGTSVGSN